jgi:hypothetical protein
MWGLCGRTRIPGINGPDDWMVGGTAQLTNCGSSICGEMEIGSEYYGPESHINSWEDDQKLVL